MPLVIVQAMVDGVVNVSEQRPTGTTTVLVEIVSLSQKTQRLKAWQAWRQREPFSLSRSCTTSRYSLACLSNGLQPVSDPVQGQGCGLLIETTSVMEREAWN